MRLDSEEFKKRVMDEIEVLQGEDVMNN